LLSACQQGLANAEMLTSRPQGGVLKCSKIAASRA
jgi:hypothetical protein